jgi:hypothetical protein
MKDDSKARTSNLAEIEAAAAEKDNDPIVIEDKIEA